MLQLAVTRLCKTTRERTYGNNTQRGLSKEQERCRREGGKGPIRLLQTKNKDSSGETKKIYTGEFERLVRIEDFEL